MTDENSLQPSQDASDILSIIPPPFEWCLVPAGEVRLGHAPTTVEVEPFWIAKYLITYEQFQVFVDAEDGFRNPEWWKGLDADINHRNRAGDQRWPIDTHPRESVSWWDAIAFCQWLNARLDLRLIPPHLSIQTLAGYEGIRLPVEWEWQRAARRSNGYECQYEHSIDTAECNIRESGIGMTSAVDFFQHGASFYGVLDMIGNVWEWCLNERYRREKIDLAGNDRRILCGGSWFDTCRTIARCEFRLRGKPDYRDAYGGFRVCMSHPFSL